MLMIIQYTNFLYKYNGINLNWMRTFTQQSIPNTGKSTHDLKVANFMINLKNTKLLSFLCMFRSCKPGLIIVPTES